MAESYETASYGFTLNRMRLEQVVLALVRAAQQGVGIFEGGLEQFLPQWNLPLELEYNPRKTKTKFPLKAVKFLWTRLFCDRLSSSRFLMQTTLEVWGNTHINWIYEPSEVVERTEDEIDFVLRNKLKFGLTNKGKEEPNGERFKHNARAIVDQYGGDPRKLIQGKTVDQARAVLMEFKGIGTGLANLFILQLLEREIANPCDPENAYLKVDRHKAGVPIYTGALTPTNSEIDSNLVVPVLEEEYRRICRKHV